MKREGGQEGRKDGRNHRDTFQSGLCLGASAVQQRMGEREQPGLAFPSCKALFRLTVLPSSFQLSLGRTITAPGLSSVSAGLNSPLWFVVGGEGPSPEASGGKTGKGILGQRRALNPRLRLGCFLPCF